MSDTIVTQSNGKLKTSVEYDRSRRQWILRGEIGEELAAFPAGAEGKHQALTAHLEIECPDVLALAQRAAKTHPALNSRPLKAAQIVAAGGILPGLYRGEWAVQSQSDPNKRYAVAALGRWRCTCLDWQRGEQGEPFAAPHIRTRSGGYSLVCKHILAVMFYQDLLPWPPTCPQCGQEMVVRTGDGQPFWSCVGFPGQCQGRLPFTLHPDDQADPEGPRLSIQRAHHLGLIGQNGRTRRRDQRQAIERARAAEYRQRVAAGEDPAVAAEMIDASFMSFDEWKRHHQS